jgi:hypothetical protein
MRLVMPGFAIYIGRKTGYTDLHSSLFGAFRAGRAMLALLDVSLPTFIHSRKTAKHFKFV